MTTCSEILLFPEDALMPYKDSIPVTVALGGFPFTEPFGVVFICLALP